MFVPTLGNDGGKIEGKGRGRKEGRRRAWATKVGRRGLARDVSTFVEAEPTAVFVCHLCPFRAEPRARANGPPDGLDKEEKRLFGICSPPFSSLSLSLSSRVKAARIVFQNFHGGHQWRRALIRSDATIPGPPRRFSRIRLGRHEFATLFRHGLFIPFLFDLFPPLLSRRTTDTAPFFFLSVFDGNSFAGTIGFLC